MWTISKARNRKGFTLIELMIVVAIIIVLSAIAIPNYLKMVVRARKSAVMSDMKAIGTALEAYNTDWGEYPGTDWASCKSLLEGTGQGTTTITGEPGGIVYMKDNDLTAFENKVDASNITYSVDGTTGDYTLEAKPTWNKVTYDFKMTGGTITVSH